MITLVLPFETALDTALRKISDARNQRAADLAEAHGVGMAYGYYLAGAIPALTYSAARDRLRAQAATQRAHHLLREELERGTPPHLELVK